MSVYFRPKVDMAEAMFDYAPQHAGDLALKVGDKVTVTRKGEDGWWTGKLRGAQGNFPGELHMSSILSSLQSFILLSFFIKGWVTTPPPLLSLVVLFHSICFITTQKVCI